MIKNTFFVREILKQLKQIWKSFQRNYENFIKDHPRSLEHIQLTFLYFFALIDITHSTLNHLFSIGIFPELLKPFFPYFHVILRSPIFQIWSSPEKIFFFSYVVIEIMIIRSIFQFSKLVKYNILLIFALIMLQSLAVSYWDIFFHREIAIPVSKSLILEKGSFLYTDKRMAVNFFFSTFAVFLVAYLYFYFRAMQGKFASIPGMEWLTDSIAFWVRIKTPTMRAGKQEEESETTEEENENPESSFNEKDDEILDE